MRRTLFLLPAVTLNLALLASSTIPLGVPGEWVWPRQSLPDSFLAALDRLLLPVLTGAGLLAFCRFADHQIPHSSGKARALFLIGLVLGSFTWLNAVRQAAASPHRELRPLWVLYDKYASGYFFEAAFRTNSQAELLSTYEARMAKGDVLHEGTHPPGLLLLNWWAIQATRRSEFLTQFAEWTQPSGTVRMFRSIESQAAMARPLSRTELAALCLVSFVSSLLAAMTVCPVYALVRLMSDSRTAWRAACLMITIPSLAVFVPRSDVVYAFSAGVLLWLFVATLITVDRRRQVTMAVGTAVAAFLSLSVSLSHIPVLVAGATFSLLLVTGSGRKPWRRLAVIAALMLSVFFVLCALWNWMTHCNLLRVWQMNLSNHAAFYGQSPRTWWKWVIVNPLELSSSVGLPLMLVSLAGLLRAARQFRHFKGRLSSGGDVFPRLVVALMATWVVLWLSGKNMGEAARLWCFLTPWIVISAALSLSESRNAASGHSPGDLLRETGNPSYWLLLMLSQLIVCTATVGGVSGYLEL